MATTKHMVYLIRCIEDGNMKYKIGYTTRSAERRIKEMETANPGAMDVVAEFHTKHARQLEGILHRHYDRFCKGGEWFNFGDEGMDRETFFGTCMKYNRNLDTVRATQQSFANHRNKITDFPRSTFENTYDDVLL